MSDTIRVTFQFALGQQVRWADDPAGRVWHIVERHFREGRASCSVEYALLLHPESPHGMRVGTAYEPDLAAWEDIP